MLRFGDIEIPRELVNAHDNDELVLFVGAGASMGSPSNLPSFVGLTESIRDESQLGPIIGDVKKQALDEVMGEIADSYDVDVHLRAAIHTNKAASMPNALHQAIADLSSQASTRIVTTNYDVHLSSVLGDGVRTYVPPAFPLGSDFTGLVHLHGSVTEDPKHLVVTAADFGKAYLTDAWAARFLERMFATYTTLFIGYSHNDVIMKYLARGLGSRSRQRYACTHEPDSPIWGQLNIIPVGYSSASNHLALSRALSAWASRAASGLLDHRKQVAAIMTSHQPAHLAEAESSYLHSVVSDDQAVQFFCQHATGLEWLAWVCEHPTFQELFHRTSGGSAATWRLANWFSRTYINELWADNAQSVLQKLGGQLSQQLWDAVARRLLALKRSSGWPANIRPWLLPLIRSAPEDAAMFLDALLSHCSYPADSDAVTLLMSYLIQPSIVHVPSVFGDLRPEVHFRGNAHQLHDTWQKNIKPNLSTNVANLLPLIDQTIRFAQRDLNLSGVTGRAEQFGSLLEPVALASGAKYAGPGGFITEAARDCIEALFNGDPTRAELQLTTWALSHVCLLRRLAIHGWTVRKDVTASVRAAWMVQQGLILDYDYQSEISPFIACIIESEDPAAIDIVLADILEHADDDDYSARRAWRTFNWMRRLSVATGAVDSAISTLLDSHEDLADLANVVDPAPTESSPRTSAEELKLVLETDVTAAVTLLQQSAKQDESTGGFAWYDSESALTAVVSQTPVLGLTLLKSVDRTSIFSAAVARPIVRGWSNAAADEDLAENILTELLTLDLTTCATEVALLLSEIRQEGSSGTPWQRHISSRTLAHKCWDALSADSIAAQDDWYYAALNSPAGHLALYWLLVADQQRSDSGTEWTGLPPDLAKTLTRLVAEADNRGDLAAVMYGRHLAHLHALDPTWCNEHILRLFDWANETQAQRVWSGYLTGGIFNEDLLRSGLMHHALEAASRAHAFNDRARHNLLGMLAQIALRPDLQLGEWIPVFTRRARQEDRVLWMNRISDYLADMEPAAVEACWARWMLPYWKGRLSSVPRRLTKEEASAMAHWVVYLDRSTAEAVELVLRQPASFPMHSRLLGGLTDERVQKSPSEMAQLIAHLLCGTELPFYEYRIPEVMGYLRQHDAAHPSLHLIEEHALRLGIDLDED